MRRVAFNSTESLTRWLLTTKWGAEVMRDVLHSPGGSRYYAEFVERELAVKRSRVVVELAGDGFVRVYGERHVDVRIVQRPIVTGDLKRWANLVDEFNALSMPLPFRDVYWPNCVRATHCYRSLTAQDVIQAEVNRQMETAVVEACNRMQERS